MKISIQHPTYGEIVYSEGLWSGKKTCSINGNELRKLSKTTYQWDTESQSLQVELRGSQLTGVSLSICDETIQITPKPSTIDWVLSALPLVLILIWGNSITLCSIIPVAGGAIGGAIGGAAMVYTALQLRQKSIPQKLLIALLSTLCTFAVGAGLGFAVLAALIA